MTTFAPAYLPLFAQNSNAEFALNIYGSGVYRHRKKGHLTHYISTHYAVFAVSLTIATYFYMLRWFFCCAILWIGKNTLIILSTHQVIKWTLLILGNEFIQQSYIWQSLQWIIMFLLIFLFNRFTPKLVGKSNLINNTAKL
jgi:hypothetical protein